MYKVKLRKADKQKLAEYYHKVFNEAPEGSDVFMLFAEHTAKLVEKAAKKAHSLGFLEGTISS